jgi:predicted alpha-1,2-mannosidase
MKHTVTITAFLMTLWLLLSCGRAPTTEDHTRWVDPFIGTGGHGHTFPGAVLPFGGVQLSPDNGRSGWDWCSGYHITENTIAGFSHLHISGTGIGDLCDILVLPACGPFVDDTTAGGDHFMQPHWSSFSHEREYAEPGYYSVFLEQPAVEAELTVTRRAGFHRYTFKEKGEGTVVFDLGFHINWDRPVKTFIRVDSTGLITGYRFSSGWARDQRVWFAARFSRPFSRFVPVKGGAKSEGREVEGKNVRGIFYFDDAGKEPLLLKVGISSADEQGARASLQEIDGWDFDGVRAQAHDAWQKELSKIEVETPDTTLKKIFYTSLYHTMMAPFLYSDPLGNYKGADGKVHNSGDHARYTVYSLWDTYRAEHPLFTLIQQDRLDGILSSMMDFYREYGLLPVWALTGNETNTMVGYHAVPVLADAYAKGLLKEDPEEVFGAMKKSSMTDIKGLKWVKEMGYIPADKERHSVSKGLEYAIDDWCIADMARRLGKKEEEAYYLKRAGYYRNYFDTVSRFMRGRMADGSWRTPFNPLYSSHESFDYTEGNAWQYTWLVPHDVEGLIRLMGGRKAFVEKLDSLFTLNKAVEGENASPDISGLIGQYAHGNEPSHHIAYMYDYAGVPWKTQERVDQILRSLYFADPNGLSGNEDCGQMSAWFVLSSLGFYQENPADGNFVFGRPVFRKAVIRTGKEHTFTILTHNNQPENKYIKKVLLNGKELKRTYVTFREINAGGTLEFELSPEPVKDWGSDLSWAPPSMTKR